MGEDWGEGFSPLSGWPTSTSSDPPTLCPLRRYAYPRPNPSGACTPTGPGVITLKRIPYQTHNIFILVSWGDRKAMRQLLKLSVWSAGAG